MQLIKHGRNESKKILTEEGTLTLETTTKSSRSRTPKLIPRPIHRPRLLLASDSSERLRELQGLARSLEFEITSTDSMDGLLRACHNGYYEVVVLDVAPAQLEPILKLIRMNERSLGSLVLVEASEIHNDLNLAGVLPLYRAMPCSRLEMTKLLKRLEEKNSVTPDQRGML